MFLFLLKLTIAWGMFALLYRLALRRETFFQINRAYLLLTMVLGLALPFSPMLFPVLPGAQTAGALVLPEISVGSSALLPETAGHDLNLMLLWAYGLGAGWALLRFLSGLGRLLWLSRRGCAESLADGCVLIRSEQVAMPFSFFRWIFVPVDFGDETPELKPVLDHERAHAFDGHSLDVLLFELLGVALWFHPLAHWYRKAIREVHEFLADDSAARQSNRRQYGLLLLQQAQTVQTVSFVHHFYQSPLKQRLIMLTKKSSAPVRGLQYGLLLPVALLLAVLFQAPVSAQTTATSKQDNTVLTTCDKMPEFPGGKAALMDFLVKNIRYPQQARIDKAEAMVIMEFVVNEDGSIGKVGPKAELRDKYRPDFIEESVRVIRAMPKWIPGENNGQKVKCMVTLPIKYKLD
ncbi:MAG TPA: M56 family metallopeptidase [Saprospiraceae bacterium]|nr:M56 family metallopeptidase [Saprospiraceae bacterium]